MKLILLLSIVAAASAFNSWDLPAPPTPNAPDMEQVRQQLAQQLLDSRGEASLHLEAFHGLMGRLQHAQLQDQTACNNALAAVSSLSTCVSTFSGLYSLSTAACPAAVTSYCDTTNTNSCASKFKAVLDNVVATCSAAELDAVTGVNTGGAMVDFNKLRSLFTLPCVTDNASPPNQCFCKFFAINSVNTASSSDSLTAALDTLCVPCTQIFFSALTAFSKSDIGTLALAAALQLLCLKDSGKYCFVYITKDYPAFALTGPSSSQLFEFLCANRCFEKYLAFNVVKADYNAGNTMTSATDSIRALCARDPSGNLCVLTATNYIASQTGVGTCPSLGSIIPTSACPSTCATFIKNFVNDNGCCASSWLAIQDIGQTNNVKSQNVKDWAKASCGASSIPAPCLSTATVKARIKIRNFLYSYYIAHQAAIDNAIRSDLGTFLQLPPSDVTIDASTNAASVAGVTINAAADNGVYYDVTIGAGSVNAVKGIGAQLSDSITTGTIGFAAVSNTVPPSGRADPAQSISADTTASVSVKSGAASSAVSPLVLLCSVFAVVLVLFKQ